MRRLPPFLAHSCCGGGDVGDGGHAATGIHRPRLAHPRTSHVDDALRRSRRYRISSGFGFCGSSKSSVLTFEVLVREAVLVAQHSGIAGRLSIGT